MSATQRDWLPAEAANCDEVRTLVHDAVGRWAAKWFVRAEAAAAGFETCAGRAPAREWLAGGTVAVQLAEPGVARLASLALRAPADRPVLSEADRDIGAGLARSVADDLGAGIEQALGVESAAREAAADPFVGEGGLLFEVADGSGQMLLRAAIPACALIAFRKAAMAPPRRRKAPLTSLGRTAEATRVRIGTRLGSARLPLAEVARLAAGDVLVLDRAIDDGAELTLPVCGRTLGRGQLLPGEAGVSLLLQQ